MGQQVRVKARRRTPPREQPPPSAPPSRPTADTRAARDVIKKIDELLGTR